MKNNLKTEKSIKKNEVGRREEEVSFLESKEERKWKETFRKII